MTAECNLPVGFERDAAIKVTPDAEGVSAGFRTAIAMSGGETRAMGLRGRQVCEELYSLDTVAEKVGRMYQWAGGAAVPVDDILMTGKSSSS
ncbi:MAG: hypothetical protein JWO82_2725, partial [Akkermansiaceae bacterium]|nr:hypothetical protein [Akkermansiaceae bacterium]